MKIESNRGVNLHMQSMVWNDFLLLSHPSPLPLISQSEKHHKEPMFIYIYIYIYIYMYVYLYLYIYMVLLKDNVANERLTLLVSHSNSHTTQDYKCIDHKA